jgi:hypothetical protein
MREPPEDRSRDLQVLVASSFLTFLENFVRGNSFSHICHVLLHLRHLNCWSCPLCLGFTLRESEKSGDKRLNERETIASTCQGDIGRSTRETLGDPHRGQCSVKEFCCIFLSLLSSRFVRVAELELVCLLETHPLAYCGKTGPFLGLVVLPIAPTSWRCYNLSTARLERSTSAGNHRERGVRWAD